MSIDTLGQHAPHPFFGVSDDCITIQGRSLLDIAAQVGRTPFYVYSRQHISERVNELRLALPRAVHIHYAVKANPMPAVVHHLAGLVDGLDVASAREMRIALDAGAPSSRISFAGPGKTREELEQAVANGIVINAESELELARLADIASRTRSRPKVAMRVNPDFELKASGMKMGGGPKPFGVDAERAPELLSMIGGLPLEFIGFHIFSGSQSLRSEAVVDAQRKSVSLAIRLASFAPAPVQVLNIGGGFGIPYFPGDQALDVGPVAAALEELVGLCQARLPQATLVVELGRYLVGEAGLYVCTIVDRKMSRGEVFLITNGGLHHHLAATGNFGQVLRKNYPVLIGNHVRGDVREIVTVVGPLCTPLDVLAHRMDVGKASVGDLVVVLQSGAYGLTASPLNFLSQPPPAEILL